ncbi:uncharacterized protein PHACADRAFT_255366 [Phanerochaete carnosa HHB-10118-sp]|uniref:Uncharacterized protein n=1 Tax=Phanerochaete carnosa (strain HHB-10118-sp) TaxID=650164 RepID=K5UY48_PHACS|nr:uncharacterized protein PHACADRAFT_255366 [Phanerochaete carnosa HHB-10118-sp]EKM55041.1 hypothetical protein PHACADRAFT_255366 [Phanerochaete carnosa HHB-10118-sp]
MAILAPNKSKRKADGDIPESFETRRLRSEDPSTPVVVALSKDTSATDDTSTSRSTDMSHTHLRKSKAAGFDPSYATQVRAASSSQKQTKHSGTKTGATSTSTSVGSLPVRKSVNVVAQRETTTNDMEIDVTEPIARDSATRTFTVVKPAASPVRSAAASSSNTDSTPGAVTTPARETTNSAESSQTPRSYSMRATTSAQSGVPHVRFADHDAASGNSDPSTASVPPPVRGVLAPEEPPAGANDGCVAPDTALGNTHELQEFLSEAGFGYLFGFFVDAGVNTLQKLEMLAALPAQAWEQYFVHNGRTLTAFERAIILHRLMKRQERQV